jgi:uroporphyrinogen-III decarboxylase
VSSAMLALSAPEEVKEYAKHLIETAGKGGGFIMSNGAFFDHAKPENVKAMVEAAKEYGVYK